MLRGAVVAALAVIFGALALTEAGSQPPPSATAPALTSRPAALALHPKNPHYFLFRGRPTVLIGSGVYGAVVHREFDFGVYLDELARRSLNHTRLFTGSFISSSSAAGPHYADSLVPREHLVAPWSRSAVPGYAMGGNKFDLETWDGEYFERLRSFVAEAGRRGIVVEVVLFSAHYHDVHWGASPLNGRNNVNGVGNVGEGDVYRLDGDPGLLRVQERLAQKVVQELALFDNVYYEVMNEPYRACAPPAETCSPPVAWEDHVIGVIEREESRLGVRHLIARGVADGATQVHGVHPRVSVLNFHYASPEAVRLNYRHRRVIAHDETGFRGVHPLPYRVEAWEFLLAGGAVFSNLDWSFTPAHENGSYVLAPDFHPGGGGAALRAQLQVLRRFLSRFDLLRMHPARSIVRRVPRGASVEALAEPGRQYAIYVRRLAGPLELTLPRGRYRGEWVDPETGRRLRTVALDHRGGRASLTQPAYREDVALALRRARAR